MIKGKQKASKVEFSRASYEENDKWGINHVKAILKQNGFDVFDKVKEDYGVDIICYKDGITYYFEAEVSVNNVFTNQEDFKYPSVSFLARKKKWAKKGFWYVIISKETGAYVMAHSKDIFLDKYKAEMYIDSEWRQGMDYFYRVPNELCIWNEIKV